MMLKANTHQTMRDLSSTVWDTLRVKASSPKAANVQKQTPTYAERVRQEGRWHTRGPPFVWAHQGLIRSLQDRSNEVGTRTAHGSASCWTRLEPLLPTQICDEVRFCRLDKTYKADVKRIDSTTSGAVAEVVEQTFTLCREGSCLPSFCQ